MHTHTHLDTDTHQVLHSLVNISPTTTQVPLLVVQPVHYVMWSQLWYHYLPGPQSISVQEAESSESHELHEGGIYIRCTSAIWEEDSTTHMKDHLTVCKINTYTGILSRHYESCPLDILACVSHISVNLDASFRTMGSHCRSDSTTHWYWWFLFTWQESFLVGLSVEISGLFYKHSTLNPLNLLLGSANSRVFPIRSLVKWMQHACIFKGGFNAIPCICHRLFLQEKGLITKLAICFEMI